MQYKSFFLSLVCLGAVVQAQAELKVIGDFGGESAVRFYEALQPDESMVQAYPNSVPSTLTEADILPVASHRMTPGPNTTSQNESSWNVAYFSYWNR